MCTRYIHAAGLVRQPAGAPATLARGWTVPGKFRWCMACGAQSTRRRSDSYPGTVGRPGGAFWVAVGGPREGSLGHGGDAPHRRGGEPFGAACFVFCDEPGGDGLVQPLELGQQPARRQTEQQRARQPALPALGEAHLHLGLERSAEQQARDRVALQVRERALDGGEFRPQVQERDAHRLIRRSDAAQVALHEDGLATHPEPYDDARLHPEIQCRGAQVDAPVEFDHQHIGVALRRRDAQRPRGQVACKPACQRQWRLRAQVLGEAGRRRVGAVAGSHAKYRRLQLHR
mmetsp:Transcript_1377/g.4500  ORF Transcript_1377/g.4500 Transcript_1377/m.4500 type:complete len:288 (+) Transcript_1377:484-1347(+)